MKYTAIILLAILLVACQLSTVTAPKEVRMPANDIAQLLRDHLPEDAVSRVDSKSSNEDQFDFELTAEQFKHLQHVFANKVEDYARAKHSYDRFKKRATTFTEGFSSFSVSLGKGEDFHYIIIGSFVLVDDKGKAVIWIKPTQG
jgi:hypothetical protein